MTVPATIPRRTGDITAKWLATVFEDAGISVPPIAALDVSRVGEGAGFAGRALRLSVTYEAPTAAPTSFVAKMPAGDPAVREMMARMRGYELEGRFYTELADATPIPIPRCYWSGMNLGTGDFFLLLEDLEEYSPGKQTGEEPRLGLIEELVKVAARLHARWWNDHRSAGLDWLPTPGGSVSEYFQDMALAGVDAFVDRFEGRWPSEQLEMLSNAMRHATQIERAASGNHQTLIHGDYRLDNVMYALDSPRAVVVIDWQLVTLGSGPYDLAYLFGQSLPIEFRRAHESALLDLYLSELRGAGITDYDEAQLRRDYALGLVLAARVPVTGSGNIRNTLRQIEGMPLGDTRDAYERANTAYVELVETMAERQLAALLDHDALPKATRALG